MKKTLILSLFSILFIAACGNSNNQEPAERTPADFETNPESISNQNLDADILAGAINTRDLASCDEILGTEMKEECKTTVDDLLISDEAYEARDLERCGEVLQERYRNNCENMVNKAIEAENMREIKTGELNSLIEANEGINDQAIETGDLDLCDQIEDQAQRAACQYNVISSEVISTGDASLCDSIEDESLVSECNLLTELDTGV